MTENNNSKIHKYIHTFKDGNKIDLIVDLTEDKIKFSSSIACPITIYNCDEYYYWIVNVV